MKTEQADKNLEVSDNAIGSILGTVKGAVERLGASTRKNPNDPMLNMTTKLVKHLESCASGMRVANPIVSTLAAVALYADTHENRFGSPIGEDYVLGEGIKQILSGVRVLLNGELEGLDGGTLDAMILNLAQAMGFSQEEIENI